MPHEWARSCELMSFSVVDCWVSQSRKLVSGGQFGNDDLAQTKKSDCTVTQRTVTSVRTMHNHHEATWAPW